MGLPDDLRSPDPRFPHRFLWSNHLGHSVSYDIPMRFGAENINPTRRLLFRQIAACPRSLDWTPPVLCHCGGARIDNAAGM